MHLGVEFGADVATMFLERMAQARGRLGRGLGMAFGDLFLQLLQGTADGQRRLLPTLGQLSRILHVGGREGLAARQAQLIGPDRDCGQGCLRIVGRGPRQRQGRVKSLPDHTQQPARGRELGRELRVQAVP